MLLATTTGDFSPFTSDHKERIRLLCEAGFRHIDLSLYTVCEGDPLFGDSWQEAAEDLLAYAASLGADFVQCHAPGSFNPFEQDAEKRERLINATKRSLEVCSLLGIKNNVLHTGWKQGITREDCFKENLSAFCRRFFNLKKLGV